MTKAKWNEVPKSYRRDYKKEAMELLEIVLSGSAFGILLALAIVHYI